MFGELSNASEFLVPVRSALVQIALLSFLMD